MNSTSINFYHDKPRICYKNWIAYTNILSFIVIFTTACHLKEKNSKTQIKTIYVHILKTKSMYE
ncbi:hypothetical protein IC582_027050 [Cucumis melo]